MRCRAAIITAPSTGSGVPLSSTTINGRGRIGLGLARLDDPLSLGRRPNTHSSRHEAVQRVIEVMREQIADPLSLDDMARVAMFSPYHFHRVFRIVTGVPPARFLTALRMAEACRLLLTTQMRVTDVCFEVGFGSPGTFTTRFGRLVGAPPQQLRTLADRHAGERMSKLACEANCLEVDHDGRVTGWIGTPAGYECVVMLGIFSGEFPDGFPVECAVIRAPGPFTIGGIGGACEALAVGFPVTASVLEAVLLHPSRHLVGTLSASELAAASGDGGTARLEMRASSPVDPPVVLAAPLLLAEQIEVTRRVAPRRPLTVALARG